MDKTQFRRKILRWFDQHGRRELPWQKNPTAYRVWISEIMLQQTQVATVIPYFHQFLSRFPTIRSLARSNVDEVLQHWSGLGYYARARNLHKSAIIISEQYKGRFPSDFNEVVALPGIGRSTAGAILSLAQQQAFAILDGNVKRVLARYFSISGWPGQNAVLQQLWQHAEQLTPTRRVGDYNQAMMDLGAIVCKRSKPECSSCPLQKGCRAYQTDSQTSFPGKKPRKELPIKAIQMLILINEDRHILLERRPPTGVWGGLLSFPETTLAIKASHWCKLNLNSTVYRQRSLSTRRHSFTHFHLDITPVYVWIRQNRQRVMEGERWVWYKDKSIVGGFPAPVSLLLQQLDL
ncbi:MAG: A/G-specific adenine glycosylase [Thiohalomonadales bacterium]